MIFKIALFVLVFAYGYAQQIDLEFLRSKPNGVARDFYIWQFLSDKNTTDKDALEAYNLVDSKIPKIDELLDKRNIPHELPLELKCKNLHIKDLKDSSFTCIKAGLKLSLVPTLSQEDFDIFFSKADREYKAILVAIRSQNVLQTLIKLNNPKVFTKVFYGVSPSQRQSMLNRYISAKNIEKLANQNEPTFNKMLENIITSNSYEKLATSLLNTNITNTDAYTSILLGINELHRNLNKTKAKSNAIKHFQIAQKNATNTFITNKAMFWEYLVTESKSTKETILKNILENKDIDIFTLYAAQKLNTKIKVTYKSSIEGLSPSKPSFDIKDPFIWQSRWQSLNKEMKNLKQTESIQDKLAPFYHEDTQAHLGYLLYVQSKLTTPYFLMPYAKYIKWKDAHDQALTYAVAKQESHLFPALVSTSYALGMMQIMPFNVPYFANLMGIKNIEYADMFDPRISLTFGQFYLQKLEKKFKNPLFVAYAYNGGPGFLQRLLDKKLLFKKSRNYEPWLSMELVPYEESRIYGQKVLSNYIIYQEILGNNINLESMLKQTLIY